MNVMMGTTPEAEDAPQLLVRSNASATKIEIQIEFNEFHPSNEQRGNKTLLQSKSSETIKRSMTFGEE